MVRLEPPGAIGPAELQRDPLPRAGSTSACDRSPASTQPDGRAVPRAAAAARGRRRASGAGALSHHRGALRAARADRPAAAAALRRHAARGRADGREVLVVCGIAAASLDDPAFARRARAAAERRSHARRRRWCWRSITRARPAERRRRWPACGERGVRFCLRRLGPPPVDAAELCAPRASPSSCSRPGASRSTRRGRHARSGAARAAASFRRRPAEAAGRAHRPRRRQRHARRRMGVLGRRRRLRPRPAERRLSLPPPSPLIRGLRQIEPSATTPGVEPDPDRLAPGLPATAGSRPPRSRPSAGSAPRPAGRPAAVAARAELDNPYSSFPGRDDHPAFSAATAAADFDRAGFERAMKGTALRELHSARPRRSPARWRRPRGR